MKFTNFSIEEILKPAFGLNCLGRKQDGQVLEELPWVQNGINQNTYVIKEESLEDRLSGSPLAETQRPQSNNDWHLQREPESFNSENTIKPELESRRLFPAWVYCTRYSDRPAAGPRSKRRHRKSDPVAQRHRTSFSREQIERLTTEFRKSPYLTEFTRQTLSSELNLHESQIKIWFQNKRAKSKKARGGRSILAINLLQQGLYNHVTRDYD